MLYLTLKETQSCLKVLLQISEKKSGKRQNTVDNDECDSVASAPVRSSYDDKDADDHMINDVEERIRSLLTLHDQVAKKQSRYHSAHEQKVYGQKNNVDIDSDDYEEEENVVVETPVKSAKARPTKEAVRTVHPPDSDIDNLPNWMILDLLDGKDPFKPVELEAYDSPSSSSPVTRHPAKNQTQARQPLKNQQLDRHRQHDRDQSLPTRLPVMDCSNTSVHRSYELCRDEPVSLPDCVHHIQFIQEHEEREDRRCPDLIKPCKQKFR